MANERPKPVVKKAFTPRDTSKPMPKPAAPKQVIKIDSGAKPITSPKSMKGPVDSGKYNWKNNAFKSREGTDEYGRPTYNRNAPIKPIKVHSAEGVLGQSHMGGHSDVARGGFSDLERGGGGLMGQIK